MRRLLTYMRPYRRIVAVSAALLMASSSLQILGPLLTKMAVDRYLVPAPEQATTLLDGWLSGDPITGIAQLSLLYLVVIMLLFAFDFGQTYPEGARDA